MVVLRLYCHNVVYWFESIVLVMALWSRCAAFPSTGRLTSFSFVSSTKPASRCVRSFVSQIPCFNGSTKRRHKSTALDFSPRQLATESRRRQHLPKTTIRKMRKAELQEELSRRGLDTSGLKPLLVARMIESEYDASDQVQGESTENPSQLSSVPDPERTYILQVKGLSSVSYATAVGVVLFDVDSDSYEEDAWVGRKFLPRDRSIFETDYTAIIVGLEFALNLGVKKIHVQIDNDVVFNQIDGIFKVSRESLKPLYWRIMEMKESSFDGFSTGFIHPKDNGVAEDLASKALATGISVNIGSGVKDPMYGNDSTPGENSAETLALETFESASEPLATPPDLATSTAVIDPSKTYLMQFDGGARGNPTGIAGAGMVIYDEEGQEVWCGWKFLDRMSNNQAEYNSLILGIKGAKSLGIRNLCAKGDSDLVVKQVNGLFQVKNAKLQELCQEVHNLIADFESFQISHVRRNENARADCLANHAMDYKDSGGLHDV